MREQIKQYRFGFCWQGFAVFVLVMLPNILWMVLPPQNDVLATGVSLLPTLDVLENVFRVLLFAALVFVVRKPPVALRKTWLLVAVVCLVCYYVLWIFYFNGNGAFALLLAMAVFPSIVFVASTLWLQNGIALLCACSFGALHIVNICLMFW